MLNSEIIDQLNEVGSLHEEHEGMVGESISPVLATPATVGAFAGGAAVVTGAYGAGHAAG